jgi:hypothetical protein
MHETATFLDNILQLERPAPCYSFAFIQIPEA